MGRGVSQETRDLVERARELWETVYEPADIVPTVRQYFYALAVEELVPKSDKGYSIVQRVLARARERGAFPWAAVYDGLRQVKTPNTWEDLSSFYGTVRRSYRLDKWALQPRRVEVWIEKDAVRGTVEAVTDAEEVPLLCGRGYLSATAKKEACTRIAGGPRTVIYIGDFDPSGVDMIDGAEEWIRREAGEDLDLVLERIAVTRADHADPSVSHLPVNPKDPRAREYVERFGSEVVEVEALPPETLQARLRAAVERHRDPKAWRKALATEKRERAELQQRLA